MISGIAEASFVTSSNGWKVIVASTVLTSSHFAQMSTAMPKASSTSLGWLDFAANSVGGLSSSKEPVDRSRRRTRNSWMPYLDEPIENRAVARGAG
jgi:hypothetical protein